MVYEGLEICGKIFTWIIITLYKLVHWFPTSKINTILFQNVDVLGWYNDIIWTYVCCNFRHCKVHAHIQASIYLKCENVYGWNFNMTSHWWRPLRKKTQNTHNLNSLFFNGCLGGKFKNCWNDWSANDVVPKLRVVDIARYGYFWRVFRDFWTYSFWHLLQISQIWQTCFLICLEI